MRLILVAVLMAGCSSTKTTQPPAVPVPTPGSIGSLGSSLDKGDSKVASAVTVMIESSDKPAVVQSEGRVALAHLPAPAPSDLQAARKRANAADQKSYETEIIQAKVWLAKVEGEWKDAVAQSKKNADELNQARSDLVKAQAEVKDLRGKLDKADRDLWSIVGVGLFVIGVFCGAVFGWRIGGSILACAPLAGAVPVIINSQYFTWTVCVTVGIAACLLLWRLFDYIKDKNDEKS